MGVPLQGEGLLSTVRDTLEEMQYELLRQATAFRDSNIVDVDSYQGLKVRSLSLHDLQSMNGQLYTQYEALPLCGLQ